MAAALAAEITPSRDNVIALQTEQLAPPSQSAAPRRKPGGVRGSYHASLYLPDEAQFAMREIALAMRYAKPHDVMLEAMAELFEKYNKAELAAEVRARMSRDRVKA